MYYAEPFARQKMRQCHVKLCSCAGWGTQRSFKHEGTGTGTARCASSGRLGILLNRLEKFAVQATKEHLPHKCIIPLTQSSRKKELANKHRSKPYRNKHVGFLFKHKLTVAVRQSLYFLEKLYHWRK